MCLIQNNGYLSYTLPSLAASNYVLEHALHLGEETSFDLRDNVFDNLLERNHETHDRPNEKLGVYVQALGAVALKYATRLEDDGFFHVGFSDTVSVMDRDSEEYSVRVRDLLDRSGLAYLRPVDLKNLYYRFDPFWLHVHLIERHNRSIDQEWTSNL